jgi:ankyrin repeat protein
MSILIKNPTVNIQVTEPETEVNAFWIAAFYGHGSVMKVLAEKGINIFNVNKSTGSNVLHIAT